LACGNAVARGAANEGLVKCSKVPLEPTAAVGLVDDERWQRFVARRGRFERNLRALDETLVRRASGDRITASQLLRQPDIRLDRLVAEQLDRFEVDPRDGTIDITSAETAVKYAGYLRRQESEVERARRDERRRIPHDFPFDHV